MSHVLTGSNFNHEIVAKPCVPPGWMMMDDACIGETAESLNHDSEIWQPSRRDQSHSNHLPGQFIVAHDPVSQFQIHGLFRLTIRWDHDAMVGGGSEGHRIVNPQFAERLFSRLVLGNRITS